MQTTQTLHPSPRADDLGSPDPGARHWSRFLRSWGIAAGLAMAGLFIAFSTVQSSAAQSPLAERYQELAWATTAPGLYRLASAFDVAVWLALGGMFVAFGALLAPRAKVRGTLITACGVGQIAGAIGAFTRLEAMTKIASDYNAGDPDQQAELLRSALDLQLMVYTHFAAGSALWTAALFLVASVAWRVAHFPRWLAVLMVVTGVMNLTTDVFGIVSNGDAPTAVSLLALTGLMVVFFGVGQAFRSKSALRRSMSAPAAL